MPIALFIVGIILCLVLVYIISKQPKEDTSGVRFSDDEVEALVDVLTDWDEMNSLRLLNNVSRIDEDSGHYDEAFVTRLHKTSELVKSFQDKL